MTPQAGSWRRRIDDLVRRAEHYDVVVLNGSVSLSRGYDQLLAARQISRTRPRTTVVLADCTWEPGSRAASRLLGARRPVAVDGPAAHLRRTTRAAIRQLRAPNLHCCVLSSHEQSTFPDFWGFERDHVHFTPYWPSNLSALEVASGGGGAGKAAPYVFSGGDSMRDYRPLLAAAPAIQAEVVIATRLPLPGRLPPNVTAGPVGSQRYDVLAGSATVAVVPLIADSQRSGGQKTYLGAMALGQAVVAPDAPGVRDYLTSGRTGLVPPAGDSVALAASVNDLLADAPAREQLGREARRSARSTYSRERYADALYGLASALAS